MPCPGGRRLPTSAGVNRLESTLMPLSPGSRFAHYEVISLLDEGGMGQVWRATDTRLRRDVALKTLPEAFAADADRLARFEREAQLLASLNHPNIAQIHGIEKSDGTRALVLELVEGPTLGDALSRSRFPSTTLSPSPRRSPRRCRRRMRLASSTET